MADPTKDEEQIDKKLASFDLNFFHGSSSQAANYFFKVYQKFLVANIYLQVDIQQMTKHIEQLEEELKVATEQQTTIQAQGKKIKNGDGYIAQKTYKCPILGCGKLFNRQNSLNYHNILKHKNPPFYLEEDAVFIVNLPSQNHQNYVDIKKNISGKQDR